LDFGIYTLIEKNKNKNNFSNKIKGKTHQKRDIDGRQKPKIENNKSLTKYKKYSDYD
jgi:hypothetical protein